EGLGMAAVEAQAVGVPCIVSTAVPSEADMGLGLFVHARLEARTWMSEIDRVRRRRLHDPDLIATSIRDRGYDARKNAREVTALYEAAVARATTV
ncbi:MAG: hypothetical protein ACKO2K_04250, partial [Alphaproteobacteria bacterium]